jgi:transposase-like protein
MIEKFIDEEARKKAVIAGATPDKDDMCGCPRCGSFRLTLDGSSYDHTYISCLDCNFSISGFYCEEFIGRWNSLDRSGNKIYL